MSLNRKHKFIPILYVLFKTLENAFRFVTYRLVFVFMLTIPPTSNEILESVPLVVVMLHELSGLYSTVLAALTISSA